MILKSCIETGAFVSKWKDGVPIHKKGGKQTLNNYHPVSFLPIRGNILERLMFKEILIMVISFMFKQLISCFTKSWSLFNIMPAWLFIPKNRIRITSVVTSVQKIRNFLRNYKN